MTPTAGRVVTIVAFWFLGFAALLVAATSPAFSSDEFIFLADAKRVADGDVPTRDFFQFVMPGWLLLTGGLFKLVGPSMFAARALQAALVAGMAVAYGLLARALGATRWLAFAVGATPVAVFLLPRYAYSHRWFAQAALALTLVLAWRALGQRRAAAWGLVGLGAGLTYATHQQDGAALIGGLALGGLWLAWRERWGLAEASRRALWGLLGLATPLGLLGAWFLAQGALGDMLWATHVWPFSHYRVAGNHNDVAFGTDLWAVLETRNWISRAFFYAKLYLVWLQVALPIAAPLLGLAWLAGLGRADAPDRRTAFLGLLVGVAGLGFLAALRARADLAHVAAGMMPALLLAAAGAASWERAMASHAARGLRWAPALALSAFMLCGLVGTVELARRDPGGRPLLASPDAHLRAHPTMAAIARRLRPGDTLLPGQNAAIYTFYLAPNATRYNYWLRPYDGYTSPAQFAEILAEVRRRKPRLLVITARDRKRADKSVVELLDAYRLVEVLPHVVGPGRYTWQVFVYERAEPGQPPAKLNPDAPPADTMETSRRPSLPAP